MFVLVLFCILLHEISNVLILVFYFFFLVKLKMQFITDGCLLCVFFLKLISYSFADFSNPVRNTKVLVRIVYTKIHK